ncbi:MAG TPA: MaoC family dehydratase N-terminal domain-containing protein [Candidatus Binataceae bacterium]|nr:MaoC family dehydratase N-terminal domain-containing protein [Candidatus Binataceae bacterium]
MKRDDSKTVGRTFKAREPYIVTAERIANFCAAVGENNPLYIDAVAANAGPYGGIVAPPGFAAAFRYADNVFDQLPALRGGGLMAGIDIEFGAPIRIGDSIEVASEVKEVYEKTGRTGTMKFIVVRSTLTNQNGDVVARVDHRMMRRVRG